MHSYLVVGIDKEKTDKKVLHLLKKLGSKPQRFRLVKIEDVRELSSLTKLKTTTPTTYVISGIDSATIEAQNAFLKNLEEPSGNISYILTANNEHKLLPTIVSRCLIVKEPGKTKITKETLVQFKKFNKMSPSQKLLFMSSFKNREEAITSIEGFIQASHYDLINKNTDFLKRGLFIRAGISTLGALRANGNVVLQLTNFVLNIS